MSDVFVSYKAEDKRRVKPLVEALQVQGYSVWWDEQIGGGAQWRRTIEAELNAAKCVVVIWSKRSTGQNGAFVQDEATRAQERHVYVPVLIDKVHLPLGFGETQALPLSAWKGDRSDPRYKAILAAVQRIAGNASGDAMTPSPPRKQPHVDRRAVLAGGAVATVAVAGVGAWTLLKPGTAAASGSIAVLPFANLSGDPAQAYFSDGIAEELRNALARLANLEVVGRTSSEAVRDDDARTAAKKLDVANILTGSVRQSPSTIRVAAQLIGGNDGLEKWSSSYDRAPGDAIKIQTDIAQNVARALSIQLGQSALSRLKRGGTENAEALDLLLQADPGLYGGGETGVRRAIVALDAAIALDPNYAEAYAQKAVFQNVLAGRFARSAASARAGMDAAAQTAQRAIAIAPRYSSGYIALANVQLNQLRLHEAYRNFQRGMRLPGNESATRNSYASFLTSLERYDEAWRLAGAQLALDPFNPISFLVQARVLFNWRRYSAAINSAQRALELESQLVPAREIIGSSFVMLGQPDEAQREFSQMPEGNVYRLTGEAVLAARRGNRRESDRLTGQLLSLYSDAVYYQVGEIHAQQRAADDAFAALDKAWAHKDPGLGRLLVDPFFDPIRGDARYDSLVKEVGFPTDS